MNEYSRKFGGGLIPRGMKRWHDYTTRRQGTRHWDNRMHSGVYGAVW